MAKDMVYYATQEIGTSEGITTLANTGGSVKVGDNKTKYGEWYGSNGVAWCHIFACWCANKAGVLKTLVPKTASCSSGIEWFKKNDRFSETGYAPQRNDLIYFKHSHVGIVVNVKNGVVHTIEGNSGDKVARRYYSVNNTDIAGYGRVADYMDKTSKTTGTKSSSGKNSATKASDTSKEELAYLKKVLAKNRNSKSTASSIEISKVTQDRNSNISVSLMSFHGTKGYELPVLDDMQIEFTRKGYPGKLTFTTVLEKAILYLGDLVVVYVDKEKFFCGYVFTLNPEIDGKVQVVAYDQLRYFKNKDTYMYKNKTSTQLLSKIAADFGLTVYNNPNTKVSMSRIDDNQTLFDIIQASLDETLWASGKIYTLYDDCGKLRLRQPWKVNILLDNESGQNIEYQNTIDKEVYNQVKLAYDNEKTGTQEYYISKDKSSISKWGLLQYYEKIKSPKLGKLKGKVLLQSYNKSLRTLRVVDCFGSTKVRAGCLIPVMLTIYDEQINKYMIVDKVTHKFSNSSHMMDVTLSGGDFDASN